MSPAGKVSKIAGTGERGSNDGKASDFRFSYVDGDGAVAKFNLPQGLGIDALGNLYVADLANHRIRKISFE